jgi:hypothetical protein
MPEDQEIYYRGRGNKHYQHQHQFHYKYNLSSGVCLLPAYRLPGSRADLRTQFVFSPSYRWSSGDSDLPDDDNFDFEYLQHFYNHLGLR